MKVGRITQKLVGYGRWRFSQFKWRVRPILVFPVKYFFRYRLVYDTKQYTVKNGPDHPEVEAYHRRIIKPGDAGSALLYAVGITDYSRVMEIFKIRHQAEFGPMDRFEQADAVKRHMTRRPRLVFDIGAGRGEISALFTHIGIRSVPIEPSRAAGDLVRRTYREYYGIEECAGLINQNSFKGMKTALARHGRPDTVIFCESIEHIPESEFQKTFGLIRRSLEGGGIMIVVNFIQFHPITRDRINCNHLRTIDDEFYDGLSKCAREVVFRSGSHLVLRF